MFCHFVKKNVQNADVSEKYTWQPVSWSAKIPGDSWKQNMQSCILPVEWNCRNQQQCLYFSCTKCSVCTCQPVQHSWRRWRGSPGTSWCCGHLASQPRSIFSPRSRTRSRPRLPSVSPAQRVSPIRCKQLGAQNQVHTGRWSQVLQEGGEDLACERRPASSPVGAAFEATATSRRQLRGLKALHILKKKTIKVSRILKKETFKPSTIPHCEEEENNKKVPSKYDLYEAARFYSALKRKY